MDTTAWFFELNIVEEDNQNYIIQEKNRIEKGFSYDLYLSGLA